MPDGFYYRYMTQSLAADIENIQQEVTDKGISLVVVDSGAPASLEPETSAGATAYFAALRSLHCTTLTIAHQEASGRQDRPFGSVYWRNLARANFRFQSDIQPGDNFFTIGIKHTKGNNTRRLQDVGVRFKFEDFGISVSRAGLHSVESLSKTLTLRQRMEHAVSQGAMTAQELAEELDAPLQQVKNQLTNGPFVRVETNLGVARWGNPARSGDIAEY